MSVFAQCALTHIVAAASVESSGGELVISKASVVETLTEIWSNLTPGLRRKNLDYFFSKVRGLAEDTSLFGFVCDTILTGMT